MKTENSNSTFSQKRSRRTSVDWDNPTPPFPREVFIDITNACNHSCIFCSNSKITDRRNMEPEMVLRLIKECAENGTEDIGLFATGEPFICKDLDRYVAYAKEVGIKYVFITTNGALATPQRAKPVLDAGLDSVKFSVNAGTRESYKEVHGKDDFDKVIEHIKWFHQYRQESGLKYGIYFSMVPTRIAEREWPILQKILGPYTDDEHLRGCSNQGGNMYENNEREHVEKNNLLGSLNKDQFCGKCPDPFFRCTITPQGYLTPCVVDYQNYLCVADLRKSSLKDAWTNEALVNLRKRHIAKDLKGTICYNCLHNCNEPVKPINEEFARPFKHNIREKGVPKEPVRTG